MRRPGEDRYTITMLGFLRLESLKAAIGNYLQCPSLEEIIIVWNNPATKPPDFGRKRVRVFSPQQGSLNVRMWPIPNLRTRAVVIADDDMYVPCEVAERVFEAWRENPSALVGTHTRVHSPGRGGELEYGSR
jgi:hypothetical protein